MKTLNENLHIPTLAEIREKELTCVIHTETREEAEFLEHCLVSRLFNSTELYWNKCHQKNTAFSITEGVITGYCDIQFYENNKDRYGTIYKLKDLSQKTTNSFNIEGMTISNNYMTARDMISSLIDAYRAIGCCRTKISHENKQEEEMKTFGIVYGKRIDTTCNEWVDTVTTYARNEAYAFTTKCDKVNYDAYTGALIASAKMTASQSKDAKRFYKLAMSMWKDDNTIPDTTVAILKILADEAFNGEFDKKYKKWQKEIAKEERAEVEKELRCSVCGKKFDTPEDARKHEQWHTDKKEAKKQRYFERCEAKRRIAKMESEKRINNYIEQINKETK